MPELNALLEEWIERYNTWRPHRPTTDKRPGKPAAESRQNWNATNYAGPRRGRRNFHAFGQGLKHENFATCRMVDLDKS
ncbi:MAG: hypothetical protein R3F19_12315 [Verrucomicrobiales bacterium]